jgi:hypothetical protein
VAWISIGSGFFLNEISIARFNRRSLPRQKADSDQSQYKAPLLKSQRKQS